MDNLTLSIEDIYETASERARSQGAYSREEWNDLIDEILEEKRGMDEIDDDDNFQYIKESLDKRYDNFTQEMAIK